mmetsp:Transcript_19507/g.55893  ORF Transcript_19507/g.55893 Transcript_19507/m.55893 type:complete len:143 (+) Transcript_19507:564-992(+)
MAHQDRTHCMIITPCHATHARTQCTSARRDAHKHKHDAHGDVLGRQRNEMYSWIVCWQGGRHGTPLFHHPSTHHRYADASRHHSTGWTINTERIAHLHVACHLHRPHHAHGDGGGDEGGKEGHTSIPSHTQDRDVNSSCVCM